MTLWYVQGKLLNVIRFFRIERIKLIVLIISKLYTYRGYAVLLLFTIKCVQIKVKVAFPFVQMTKQMWIVPGVKSSSLLLRRLVYWRRNSLLLYTGTLFTSTTGSATFCNLIWGFFLNSISIQYLTAGILGSHLTLNKWKNTVLLYVAY